MDKEITIKCPACGTSFSVESVLARSIEERLRVEFAVKEAESRELAERRLRELDEKALSLERMKAEQEKSVSRIVEGRLAEIRAQTRAETEKEVQAALIAGKEEMDRQSAKIQGLLKTAAENEQLKRRLEEQEASLGLKYQQTLTEQLKAEAEKISRQETQKNEFELKKQKMLIDQLQGQLEDAQRKIQQGSMQVQGEAQELLIEEALKRAYPSDGIFEVKKGQKGADVLQEVRDDLGAACGKIYYESKRTKAFGGDWIQKLKDDNREIKADFCVLVTQALPPGIESVGNIQGVWVCTVQASGWISMVLRESLIRVHAAAATQENRGEKMQMLYEYLTGQEFRLQFEAIVEGFSGLQKSYMDEKLKMQKIWKEREKQLEKVLLNAVGFYGSIRGIAADAIQPIKMLESPPGTGPAEEAGQT